MLEKSLYCELLIALNLQTDPSAVSFSGPRLAAVHNQKAESLPPGTSIAQAYAQTNRRLLILGAPGAGKTTLLLDLARHLLDEARRDETRPIPVIFNLSSWAQRRLPLEQWFVQELRDQYGLSKRFAQQWLKENIVLPLLDGLDEVAEPQRADCVAAINSFMQEHGAEGIVVCSRAADYQAIGAKLSLDAAVQVQPLDDTQIDQYLAWAGGPLAGVKAVIEQDNELRELVRAPLMLNILSLAYQGECAEDLLGLEAAAQRRRLFDSYVQRMFDRPARSDPHRYTRAQTMRWLCWLAQSLSHDKQTIFQIELMQPWWLNHWWQRGLYVLFATLGTTIGSAIIGALCGTLLGLVVGRGLEILIWALHFNFEEVNNLHWTKSPGSYLGSGLSFGLSSGLIFGLGGALGVSLFQHPTGERHRWQMVVSGLLVIGLVYLPCVILTVMLSRNNAQAVLGWIFFTVPLALMTGSLIWLGAIKPTESLRWSWHRLHTRRYLGLVLGLFSGLALGAGAVIRFHISLLAGLASGLGLGLVGGLGGGLLDGLIQVELQTKTRPNQGMWRTLGHAIGIWVGGGLLIGLGSGLVITLVSYIVRWVGIGDDANFAFNIVSFLIIDLDFGMMIGIVSASVISLYFGALAFAQHFALRLVCTLSGYAPWRYPRFLNYAVERILLRRVGGSYIFVHRLLMEHFAVMTDEEIGQSLEPVRT
ncbi:MAG: NACHT domain-containing protein [Oscillochloris sp.]|nr:NACHT domain-containing protein [Oscillochloris sp.]